MMFSTNTVSAVTINDDFESINDNNNEGGGDGIIFESLFGDYGNYEYVDHHLVPENQDYNSGSSYSDSNSVVSESDYPSSYSDENLFVPDDDYLTFSDTDTETDADAEKKLE